MPWAIGVHVPVDKAHSSEISWRIGIGVCVQSYTPLALRAHMYVYLLQVNNTMYKSTSRGTTQGRVTDCLKDHRVDTKERRKV